MRALLLLVAGCASEFELADHTRADVFPQVRVNAVDLLLVVDNSLSMVEEQDHLARSFASLIASLDAGESDWRVGVTTTETSLEGYRGLLAGGTDEIVLEDPDGNEVDRVAYDDGALAPGAIRTRSVPTLGISRFLPWPETPGCEWVELANDGDTAADLSGFVLRDDGRDRATFPAGTRLLPGQTLVVARSEGCGADVVFAEGFFLAHGVRWVEAETPDAERVFGDLVAVGTQGFGLEQGLENARLVLTGDENGDFLRPEADLSLLFLSDEDDFSHEPVADYVDAFEELKGGHRARERVRFGVVAGIDPPDASGASCSSALGNADYAERYVALAGLTDALERSICEDISTIAVDAGLTLSGLLVEFQLSGEPDPASLSVELYDSEEEDSIVAIYEEGVDFALEERDDGWWLVFDVAPPGEHWVVATYRVLP